MKSHPRRLRKPLRRKGLKRRVTFHAYCEKSLPGGPASSRASQGQAVSPQPGAKPRFEPAAETTNRKPLQQPAPVGATWQIRFGPDNRFRVLYDIDQEARVVRIMAIGEKQRERLFIGGEEVQL